MIPHFRPLHGTLSPLSKFDRRFKSELESVRRTKGGNNRELEHHSACINQTGQPSPFGVTARIDLFGRSLGGITQRRRRRPYLILLGRRRQGKSNDRGSVFERRAQTDRYLLSLSFFSAQKCTFLPPFVPSSLARK